MLRLSVARINIIYMKRKDYTELRTKTVAELQKIAFEKKLVAMKKNMEIMAGKEKNLKSYAALRNDISQILTLKREKEIIEEMKGDNK